MKLEQKLKKLEKRKLKKVKQTAEFNVVPDVTKIER